MVCVFMCTCVCVYVCDSVCVEGGGSMCVNDIFHVHASNMDLPYVT